MTGNEQRERKVGNDLQKASSDGHGTLTLVVSIILGHQVPL